MNSRFPDFASFQAYLGSLGMFHMDLGLFRVACVMESLGLSQPPCPSIQVVGTNGKGSTSTFLAQLFTTSGLTTGLYTSPHFLSPRERILVDGAQLPENLWLTAAEAVLSVSEDRLPKYRLTYFELLTVMAAWLFRETSCGAAVFEAGLGGAHDATSAFTHRLTVFTPIGLDHAAILGPTLTDIVRDKARAMRPDVPAVSADQEPQVARILAEMAEDAGTPLFFARDVAAKALACGSRWPDAPSMPGPYQADNLRLALAAFHLLTAGQPGSSRQSVFPGLKEDPRVLSRAACLAFIPGRFQIIPAGDGLPGLILDGAHNEPGLACLARALLSLGIKPRAVIFACLKDKDLPAMLPLVGALTGGPIIVPGLDAPGRASDPAELAASIGGGALPVSNAAAALQKIRGSEGPVLICGSLYLLAEVYALRPGWLAGPHPSPGRTDPLGLMVP